jgi:hypothetical protein
MAISAKPVFAAMGYTDPKTGVLTAGGQQALAQWHQAINSIPISVSGEQVEGAGKAWTLANAPSGNVSVVGIGASGPVPLTLGKGQAWHYSIDGSNITTEQEFEGVTASYEYAQSNGQ